MKTSLFLCLLAFALFLSCNHNDTGEKNLVAYWSFDETNPLYAINTQGKGPIAVNRGAKLVNGIKGKAMEFDGKSILQINYEPILDSFSKGITITAWINKDSASHWNTILSREIDSSWSEYFGLAVFKNHALFSIDPDGRQYRNVMDTSLAMAGNWIHLAGTYDNETFKLYVNSRLIKSKDCKGPIKFIDRNPLIIGGNSNDKNHSTLDCFRGLIDELRIYNIALDSTEIIANYNL